MNLGRLSANLATAANGLLGIGAIAYALAGNALWAMLLIAAGIGFDGLDGWLSRRAGGSSGGFGRVADSVSDAITFGVAPGVLVAYHPYRAAIWAPYSSAAIAVGGLVLALALARLVWFTLRAYSVPSFIGVPTPQNALGVMVLLLLFAVPAFLGTYPVAFLIGAAVLAVLMVLPVPFPKIRRGSPLRIPMAITGALISIDLVLLQFRPALGSAGYGIGFALTIAAAIGIAAYYLVGPWTVTRASAPTTGGPP